MVVSPPKKFLAPQEIFVTWNYDVKTQKGTPCPVGEKFSVNQDTWRVNDFYIRDKNSVYIKYYDRIRHIRHVYKFSRGRNGYEVVKSDGYISLSDNYIMIKDKKTEILDYKGNRLRVFTEPNGKPKHKLKGKWSYDKEIGSLLYNDYIYAYRFFEQYVHKKYLDYTSVKDYLKGKVNKYKIGILNKKYNEYVSGVKYEFKAPYFYLLEKMVRSVVRLIR